MEQCCYMLLRLEYHGNPYGGWQRQGKQGQDLKLPLPTVQQMVEEAAARVLGTRYITCVQVAGRTDKGVHALDQRCALRVPVAMAAFADRMNEELRDKLIGVVSVVQGRDEKFVVSRKRYKYILQIPPTDDKRPIEGLHQYSRHESRPLDMGRLQGALQLMVGTHNFQHFCKQKGAPGPAVRTVYLASVSKATSAAELPTFATIDTPNWTLDEKHEFWVVTVEGSGFLWHQVRRMVSLAVKIAEGGWSVESVLEVMSGERKGPVSAPARGLYLDRVWLQGEDPTPSET